jgi:hypothetical protein
MVLHNNVHLDGRLISSSVTEHLYQGMNQPPASGSLFDGGMSYAPSAP